MDLRFYPFHKCYSNIIAIPTLEWHASIIIKDIRQFISCAWLVKKYLKINLLIWNKVLKSSECYTVIGNKSVHIILIILAYQEKGEKLITEFHLYTHEPS